MAQRTLILSAEQIDRKVERIAYEVYENNFAEKELVVAGIYDRGYEVARQLVQVLERIANFETVTLVKISLDKQNPLESQVQFDCQPSQLKNKAILLVDDVLNTGKTLIFGMKPLLDIPLQKLEIAVLVNRSHKLFPVSVQYTGYELATTINEHIEVQLSGPEKGAYLL